MVLLRELSFFLDENGPSNSGSNAKKRTILILPKWNYFPKTRKNDTGVKYKALKINIINSGL